MCLPYSTKRHNKQGDGEAMGHRNATEVGAVGINGANANKDEEHRGH